MEPKREFPPLLAPGFRDLTVEELRALCAPASSSGRRQYLFARFCDLLALLARLGIPIEIWLDGSFLTEKQEPDDIDLVVLFSSDDANRLSPVDRLWLQGVFNAKIAKARFGCHPFFCPLDDDILRADWAEFFGKSRDGTPKGLAKLRLEP